MLNGDNTVVVFLEQYLVILISLLVNEALKQVN